jgi:hypothetical protein
LRAKLQTGKDPAKPVIFLTRMVIECLSKGTVLCVLVECVDNAALC